jgi:hypothetical protein
VGAPVGTAKLSNAGVMTNFRETKHFPNTLLDGRGDLGDVVEICAICPIPFVLKRSQTLKWSMPQALASNTLKASA